MATLQASYPAKKSESISPIKLRFLYEICPHPTNQADFVYQRALFIHFMIAHEKYNLCVERKGQKKLRYDMMAFELVPHFW